MKKGKKSKKVSVKTSIPEDRWGTHITHCCNKHGCKYGEEDCPVSLGLAVQTYSCQTGREMEDDCFLTMESVESLTFYAVRNKENKWLGKGISSSSWKEKLSEARVFRTIGPARSEVTFWATKFPMYGIPNVIVLKVSEFQSIDEEKRVNNVIKKKNEKNATRVESLRMLKLKELQNNLEIAKAELDKEIENHLDEKL